MTTKAFFTLAIFSLLSMASVMASEFISNSNSGKSVGSNFHIVDGSPTGIRGFNCSQRMSWDVSVRGSLVANCHGFNFDRGTVIQCSSDETLTDVFVNDLEGKRVGEFQNARISNFSTDDASQFSSFTFSCPSLGN